MSEPLIEAIEVLGGQTALARALSTPEKPIRQGHVWDWINKTRVPEEFCPAIEALTGVTCERLRADREWHRDEDGKVLGHFVPAEKAA